MSTKTDNNTSRRYSDAFKRQVVEAIEAEGYTHPQAAELYGCSQSSIHRWLKKYGKNHLLNKVVRIQTMDETDRIGELNQQIAELKEALADVHLDQKVTENRLKIACRQLGIDPEEFKKKHEEK